MTLGLLGTKIGMTQVFNDEGEVVPVTVVEVGPCSVLQVKTAESDGYTALQLGLGAKRESAVKRARQVRDDRKKAREDGRRAPSQHQKNVIVTQPELGHAERAGVTPPKVIREVRLEDVGEFEVGQEIKCDIFAAGDKVDVVGTSKGRGFAGPMKRHNSRRGPETHGSRYHRRTGSIGQSATPSRVRKGKPMAGHMGAERVTVLNLQVVESDPEKNLLLLRGAIPGANGGLIMIRKSIRAARRGARKAS